MARIISTATGEQALTFDDVLLQPGHSTVMPGRSGCYKPINQRYFPQSAYSFGGHGYGDGEQTGDCHGAGRWYGGDPSKSNPRLNRRKRCGRSKNLNPAW